MLTHLYIKNFTIVESLTLDFDRGLTVLTGETGAGKSIIVDAVSLALGARADSHCIRSNAGFCDITVSFNITNLPDAQSWMKANEMSEESECLIRRLIYRDGRSKSTINGQPCPQNLVRDLGQLLLQIHGQHQHQALLKRMHQQQLFDVYADNSDLLTKTHQYYQQWKALHDELAALHQHAQSRNHELDLWRYQFEELAALNLQENEWSELSRQHDQLQNAQGLIHSLNQAIDLITESEQKSASDLLQQAIDRVNEIKMDDPQLKIIKELLNTAAIHLSEARSEIHHYRDGLDLSDERLETIEQRLTAIHDCARKHHTNPDNLVEIKNSLHEKIQSLENVDVKIEELNRFEIQILQQYDKIADQLSKNRRKTATVLEKMIGHSMQELGMAGGKFQIDFEPSDERITPYGKEKIAFLVKTNPGQDFLPMQKVVSGGELSRIGLALQVIAAQKVESPTLIFDEVDTGIGGKTADVVGKLLRELGKKSQVFCITHLPQVAACGQHHFKVEKTATKDNVFTHIEKLTQKQRVEELARMLSGSKITTQTLAHAGALLYP